MNAIHKLSTFAMCCALMLSTGCAILWPDLSETKRGASSNLVDFLYPEGKTPPAQTSKTKLQVPLRVGIGFIPSAGYHSVLTEQDRDALLQQIRTKFSERDYVQDIVIIPQTYLKGRNGLLAINQIGRLYQLDVVGLVSYDQTLFTDLRDSSLLYWTIIGAYAVKGNRNQVSTFVDLAVIDVRTKKLLLRAGGTHQDQENTTLVDVHSEGRKSQLEGFHVATADLVQNFSVELDGFEQSIQVNEEIEVVSRRTGKSVNLLGSGSLLLEPLLLVLLLGWRAVRSK